MSRGRAKASTGHQSNNPEVTPVELGMVQVYTGDGKGKTTAAVGLAMRAIGKGLKVLMIQFLKGREYGELVTARRLAGDFEIVQCGLDTFVKRGEPSAEDLRLAQEGLERARRAIMSGEYDIVILDEVNVAVALGVLSVSEVLPLIDDRPPGVELVLTGREAPDEFLERADIITEMKCIKHCYDDGVPLREGIEF
jgi:cob(I)alamin adenosyltransferase